VLLFRADLYAKQRDYAKSSSAFDDAAAAATSDAEKASVMVRKALMYAQAGQRSQAEAVFNAAIQQYPKISSLHTAYGEYYIAQKDQRRAEQQFQLAIAADKNDVSALVDMAQLKQAQGRLSDAASYVKQLTNMAPSAQWYAWLGQLYVSLHDYKNAKQACARSFQINQTPDTLGCIAGSDYDLKNYKEASQIFDVLYAQVKGYMDHNPQLLYMAGDSYSKTKQNTKAVDSYKRLLKVLKPGTKVYKQIQKQIADLSRPSGNKKTKHG
jgi:tetratricopeptide (TPR) repeat protein